MTVTSLFARTLHRLVYMSHGALLYIRDWSLVQVPVVQTELTVGDGLIPNTETTKTRNLLNTL